MIGFFIQGRVRIWIRIRITVLGLGLGLRLTLALIIGAIVAGASFIHLLKTSPEYNRARVYTDCVLIIAKSNRLCNGLREWE